MNHDVTAVPDAAVARASHAVAAAYRSAALCNHATRSYLWARAVAPTIDLAFDDELLYVAAMLHDLGLTDAFDNATLPFEDAGGHAAWVFAAGAGWDVRRRDRVAQIIVRHRWDQVDQASDPEGHLLESATAVDISGRGVERLPDAVIDAVLARYPRVGLAEEFRRRIRAQATRKPTKSRGTVGSGRWRCAHPHQPTRPVGPPCARW